MRRSGDVGRRDVPTLGSSWVVRSGATWRRCTRDHEVRSQFASFLCIVRVSHLRSNRCAPTPVHARFPECKTTYRPDYFVQEASSSTAQRQYYGGVPDVLEVAEYSFVEAKLVGLFRNQMAFSQYVLTPPRLDLRVSPYTVAVDLEKRSPASITSGCLIYRMHARCTAKPSGTRSISTRSCSTPTARVHVSFCRTGA